MQPSEDIVTEFSKRDSVQNEPQMLLLKVRRKHLGRYRFHKRTAGGATETTGWQIQGREQGKGGSLTALQGAHGALLRAAPRQRVSSALAASHRTAVLPRVKMN